MHVESNLSRFFQFLGILWWVMWALVGSVSSAHSQDRPGIVRIDAFGDLYDVGRKPVVESQARIIFYRPIRKQQPGAATLYVNGRYHTSLTSGGYSTLCLPPKSVEIGMRYLEVNRQASKDGFESIAKLDLKSGKNQFVRVSDEAGRKQDLVLMAEAEAIQEIQKTRLQIHTISRVLGAVDCMEQDLEQPKTDALAPSVQQAVRQLQLSGDTLFAFGRGDIAGLTPRGLRAIDGLMAQMNGEFSVVERVHVIGHTDPFGSDELNEKLSIQRALTVRRYIESRQRLKGRVSSEGRGRRDLLVSTCGVERTQTNIDCNEPNRRVTIEFRGITRLP